MKFRYILEINKNLTKIKELNKKFDFELGKKLINDLNCTNSIVDEQNKKLNKIMFELGYLDGYDYVLSGENLQKYEDLFDEEFEVNGLQMLTIEDLNTDTKFDLTTIELLTPLINN